MRSPSLLSMVIFVLSMSYIPETFSLSKKIRETFLLSQKKSYMKTCVSAKFVCVFQSTRFPRHLPPARACTTARRRKSRGSRFVTTRAAPPVLERALEEVQVDFAERCSAHTISTGSSWDECRAAARVLRPGAMPLRKRTGLFSSFFLLE